MGGAVAEAKAPVSAGGVYGGLTSNGWPVVFDVTRDGRMVDSAAGAI
jgi:hypothetical protein